jgi:endoribonuclease Dicer
MWLPSCLDFSSETIGPKKLEAGDKMLADIMESLLGLVYLEFDYQTAMAVADELTVTVHWEEPSLEEPSERVQVDATLLESVLRATGYSGFSRPELVEEAFSHHPEVPSFERLEWVGDAVLCLSTREWIWNNFSDLELSEMVTMESALVSNEVLSFLSVQTGLHRYLSHKDHTLPSRIEAYIYSIQEDGCGLWGTGT